MSNWDLFVDKEKDFKFEHSTLDLFCFYLNRSNFKFCFKFILYFFTIPSKTGSNVNTEKDIFGWMCFFYPNYFSVSFLNTFKFFTLSPSRNSSTIFKKLILMINWHHEKRHVARCVGGGGTLGRKMTPTPGKNLEKYLGHLS